MQDDSAATRLARRLILDVLRGTILPGAPLPSVRALAAREGVSPGTVHRALAQVAQAGLVDVRGRSGAVARDPSSHTDLALLPERLEALADDPEASGALLAEFLEVRRVLAVGLLAHHYDTIVAQAPQLALAYAEVQRASTCGPSAFMEADLAFSRALIGATGNRAAQAVFTTARRLLDRVPAVAAAMYDAPETHVRAHAEVWRAFEQPESLASTVEAAMAAVDARTIARFVALVRGRT
jgi:DNA-binding FadR family transcriptional regulator